MVPLQRNAPPRLPPVPAAPVAVPVGERGALGARGPDLCPLGSCSGQGARGEIWRRRQKPNVTTGPGAPQRGLRDPKKYGVSCPQDWDGKQETRSFVWELIG